jgi:hypothetical protein
MKSTNGFNTKFWLRISIFSFFVVALLGTLMRYKIAFDFPYFIQKNLQHAHSHFALSGWVTQLLMVYIIHSLQSYITPIQLNNYTRILILNYLVALGMLVSFSISGYKGITIIFTTFSIFIFLVFAFSYIRDLRFVANRLSHKYFKASLIFGIIACIGTFVLAYNMLTKNFEQTIYLSSEYWYLHFQYNGWFLFASLGLFHHYLEKQNVTYHYQNLVFLVLVITCFPTYGLSVLWLKLPIAIYVVTVIAAILQWIAWFLLLINTKKIKDIWKKSIGMGNYLLTFVAVAFSIKITLQLFSVHPELSQLAFGYRIIVIAYLHLSLLAVTSVFLFGYGILSHLLANNSVSRASLWGIIVLIFATELVLGIQGFMSLSYTILPYSSKIMFFLSLFLCLSSLILFVAQMKKK